MSDTSTTTKKNVVVMKDYIKCYNKHLTAVVFPVYKQVLDELADELDVFYKDAEWYNEKEKNIMLHDLLDDAVFWLKFPLWNMYLSSQPKVVNDE